MQGEDTEANCKWQPVLLMLRKGKRLECRCGALAVVVVGRSDELGDGLWDVDYWCQPCYLCAQEGEGRA